MKHKIKIPGVAEFEIESDKFKIDIKLAEGHNVKYEIVTKYKDGKICKHIDTYKATKKSIMKSGYAHDGIHLNVQKSDRIKKKRKLRKLIVNGGTGIKLTGKPNKPIKVDEIKVTGGGVGIEF